MLTVWIFPSQEVPSILGGPVGPDMYAASPNRSHAKPVHVLQYSCHIAIFLPCDKNIAKHWQFEFFLLRKYLQSLATPVGSNRYTVSPNRSHAEPWKPGICMRKPAQYNVNPCDNNIAKHWLLWHYPSEPQGGTAVPDDHCWTRNECNKSEQITCSALKAWNLYGKTCTG